MELKLPKKSGEMYIYFDENNIPLYGFKVEWKNIVQFVRLADELPEFIVLPKINEKEFVPKHEFNLADLDTSFIAEGYVKGNIKLCDGCFKGIRSAKIVLPFNTSVMLDWGCFDKGAKIEFVVPQNIGLKQVYRTFDTGFDYEHENWPILCDKRIICDIADYKDSYCTREHTKDCTPYNEYKISKDYYVDEETNEIIESSHTIG